jgi:hypothetical protein
MSTPTPAEHTAVCRAEGFADHTHPTPDHEGCDFEAYLVSDWPNPNESQFGLWRFYWMDGGYWNGTHDPLDPLEPPTEG